MAIPKIIHFCWFGGKDLPELAVKCIESWKKYCPDYTLKRWDETNFDINSNRYVKEAYQNKKFAFVSDYVRLYALYYEGGIYMDTDIEILKNIDCFLDNKAFTGFETHELIMTGVLASEKNLPAIKDMLDYYKDRSFFLKDGNLDLTTNVKTITDYFLSKGLILNNTKQTIEDFTFYPKDYFSPKDFHSGVITLTENTYSIHHFNASWHNKEENIYGAIIQKNTVKYKRFARPIAMIEMVILHPILSFKLINNKIKKLKRMKNKK